MTELFDLVRRHADAHADRNGIASSTIPGLAAVRATAPSELVHDIWRPLICLVLQGSKHVTIGRQACAIGTGDSMLVTADVPTVSQITRASIAAPYYALVLELDPAILAELAVEMKAGHVADRGPVRVEPTEVEVADASARLLRLLERPAAMPVLQTQLLRELHYWLLAGRHGPAIRRLAWPDGHAQRIARAVAIIRSEFAKPLPVDRLAEAAGMSPSSFHQHFKAWTSLSPLQFQKHLRLIEARRQMISGGVNASNAAFNVGYESVSHFTREYGRLFGAPPVRDTATARGLIEAKG